MQLDMNKCIRKRYVKNELIKPEIKLQLKLPANNKVIL